MSKRKWSYPRMLGPRSARVNGAIRLLERHHSTAKAAAEVAQDQREAAALRGKATAYREAIDLLTRLDEGRRLPPKKRRYEVPSV